MIPKETLDLIIAFEGYLKRLNDGTDRVRPYRCPAGVPTIGYGSTRYFPERSRVTMSDSPISEARARECLMGEIGDECEPWVDKLTTSKLHPLSRGALISFAYNCGVGAYRASTLRRCVNEGRWDEVPAQFAKWRMGGGRILAGLVRRRASEAAMFMHGVQLMSSPVTEQQRDVATESASSRITIWLRWFFHGDKHAEAK